MDKQTSDERLLKLIEGQGGKNKPNPRWSKNSLSNISAKFNLSELTAKLKHLKVDLRVINKGLVGLAVLVTLMLLFTFVSGPVLPKSDAVFLTPSSSQAILKLISGDSQGLRRTISSEDIRRNFFLPPGTKVENAGETPVDQAPEAAQETQDFKLVGIIWSQDPEVMIENAKDSRTYTLKKGDLLDGRFKIKQITRNSAVLEVDDNGFKKEFEIR